MKKIFTLCAIAAMFAACAKEVAQTPEDDFKTPVENAELVPVEFTTNVTASVLSKAQGALDEWDGNQTLHIYGIEREASMNYYLLEPLIDNLETPSPVGIDGALQVKQQNGQPYYYEGNSTYDFYGYYIDDLDSYPVHREDGIYIPLTLTGSEDIMFAKADVAADVQRAKDNGTFGGDSNWQDKYAYSAYAVRRNVLPCLNFKHQLVQFTFEITPGNDYAPGLDPNKVLTVKNVSLWAYNKAELCVAGSQLGLRNVDRERSAVELKLDENGVDYELEERTSVELDGSLMVIPNDPQDSDVYKMRILMSQPGVGEFTYDVNLDASKIVDGDKQFKAGYSYHITAIVYSLKEIEISAKLTEWVNGGKININTDDAPVDAPELF